MQIAQTKLIVFISRFKLEFWINIVFNMEFLVLRRVLIRRAQHQAQVEVWTTTHRRRVTMILNTTPHECRKYHPHHARKNSAKCQQINQIYVTFFHSFTQFGKWLDDIHHRAILSGVLWRAELHSFANHDNLRIWYAYDQLWGTLHHIAHEERLHLRQDSDVRCWPHRRLAKSRFWHWSWRDNASGSEQHESTGNTRPSTQKNKSCDKSTSNSNTADEDVMHRNFHFIQPLSHSLTCHSIISINNFASPLSFILSKKCAHQSLN